nr:retrovirus-related Pol polyprotein from transposon TNT 1-94 [Tanacetum cinerariifolium]
MFKINPFKTSREGKHVPNTVRASARKKPITVSQPSVFTKKYVNSDSNGLSSTGVDNAKTRRPQPKSNIKNDRVPSASNNSCNKNKEAEVEEHHRNLLLSKNKNICHLHVIALSLILRMLYLKNDHVAAIMGFGDLQWGNILITRVYFVEGLGHNLFSIGQFCDSDLEVAFRRNACFVRNLEGVDLLSENRTTNLYTINLHDMAYASPICLMARASSTKLWLWHQRLSHLNFDTINDLAKHDLVSCLPKVYNRRSKKIIETTNVSFDELSAMAFEQSSSKPELQSMTSDKLSAAQRTVPAAQAQQVSETSTTSTSIADNALTPTNSSS